MNPLDWTLFAQAAPAARSMHIYWYLLPLVVAISLVYSASRHERWSKILGQSARLFGAITGIILVTTVILLLINTQV